MGGKERVIIDIGFNLKCKDFVVYVTERVNHMCLHKIKHGLKASMISILFF